MSLLPFCEAEVEIMDTYVMYSFPGNSKALHLLLKSFHHSLVIRMTYTDKINSVDRLSGKTKAIYALQRLRMTPKLLLHGRFHDLASLLDNQRAVRKIYQRHIASTKKRHTISSNAPKKDDPKKDSTGSIEGFLDVLEKEAEELCLSMKKLWASEDDRLSALERWVCSPKEEMMEFLVEYPPCEPLH